MNIRGAIALAGLVALLPTRAAAQQPSWNIVDNSFLVEEAFNQEPGVVQNIFLWTRTDAGRWNASFTQEWPAPNKRHQLSYTIPFSREAGITGVNDALMNYRFQLVDDEERALAIAPRLSLFVPTGNQERGMGSGKAGLQWLVPASKQFGDVYLHVNVGMTWIPDVERSTIVAASGIWKATTMFNVMLEAIADIDEAFTLSPGFRRGWGTEKQIVVGVATPITWGDGAGNVALLTYFSYELPFRRLH